MAILDGVNQRYGRGSLRMAADATGSLSPGYTTDWGLAVVTAG